MEDMRWEIVNLNIAHFERLLETEMDQARAETLKSLLAEAQSEALRLGKEQLLQEEHTLANGSKSDTFTLHRDVRRLCMKVEQYQMIADLCRANTARDTYLHIAHSYEALVERAKAILLRRQQGAINVG